MRFASDRLNVHVTHVGIEAERIMFELVECV